MRRSRWGRCVQLLNMIFDRDFAMLLLLVPLVGVWLLARGVGRWCRRVVVG